MDSKLKNNELNGYDLSRSWFNFCFENPEIIKPNHTAVLFFAIEQCNRLGWKLKFGFPTTMAMEATGIKSYNTYIKSFNDIVEFGFFRLIEKSKNQYSSNIIALSINDKAHNKALDKALIKHSTKQHESIVQSSLQSIDSIDKQLNKEQLNNEPITKNNIVKPFSKKDFRKTLIDLGADEIHVEDWFKVRVNKKAAFTQTALKTFLNECNKNTFSVHEAVKICAENSWKGFKVEWVKNLSSNNGKKSEQRTNQEVARDAFNSEAAKNFRFK